MCMHPLRLRLRVTAGFLSTMAAAATGAAPSISYVGDLPGGNNRSDCMDISADGSTVVGYSYVAAGTVYEAYWWTLGTGIVGIGDLPGGSVLGSARGVNSDGSIIAGTGRASTDLAFRWDAVNGMVSLGDLPGGGTTSTGADISDHTTLATVVIVGSSSSTSGTQAFRWTLAGGMVGIGDLAGGSFSSAARGISADGLVIVGDGSSSSGTEAFRWTSGTGMVGLGDLPGDGFRSQAFAASADGSVIVGTSNTNGGYEAFRWTQATGMVSIGDLPGGAVQATAFDVSADGSVISGSAWGENGSEPFIWTQATGMVSLNAVVGSVYGISPMRRINNSAKISSDGRTIAADTGIWVWNPDGVTYSFISTACRIELPAPGACCIGATCTDNVNPIACAQACGVFVSDQDSCASIACADVGACCFGCSFDPHPPCPLAEGIDGVRCAILTESECTSAGGVYKGGSCTCAPPCGCETDLNGDGITTVSDFNVLAAHFDQGNPNCVPTGHGDLNCDGVVNVSDFNLFATGYGCGL